MHWPLAASPTPDEGTIPTPGWLPDWVPGWVPEVVATLVVFALAWVVSRILVRLLNRRLARRFGRPSLTRTALRGVRVSVFLVAFLFALRINGLDLGNIALSVTVFSAVIGVVLAPIIGSYVSGLFLLADQPYEIGDMVELSDLDKRGFVEDITLRYTKIFTLDNTFVVIPNGTIRERDVVNYSAEDPRTRQTLEVLITYESDLETAQERIEAAARSVDTVIEGGPAIRIGASRYPAAPQCLVDVFADHGIRLRLRFWVTEPYRLRTVRSRIQQQIDRNLVDEPVEYAYPHSHLVVDETSGTVQVDADESGQRLRPESGVSDIGPSARTDDSTEGDAESPADAAEDGEGA